MKGWVPVCRLSEVIEDDLLSVKVCNDNLIVSRDADHRVRVASAHCPHVGTHLGKGSRVVDGVVTCPLHDFRFRLADGACLNHKNLRLVAFRSRVSEGLVWVYKDADFAVAESPTPIDVRRDSSPTEAPAYSCSWELEGDTYSALIPLFSRGGEHEEGLVVASPIGALARVKVHLAPVGGGRVRVFVIASLGERASVARKLALIEGRKKARQAFAFALRTLLEKAVLTALNDLAARPTADASGLGGDAGEDRYQPIRRFLNDWMFVAFARDIGPTPVVVERMGRQLHVRRMAGGTIEVTSAAGDHRYPSKVDPSYGVILAYFNADNAPPPWVIPDFDFDPSYEIYDSFTNATQCAVEDIHGTVLDWTHLTGFHRYDASHLRDKTVGDYHIGSSYVTLGAGMRSAPAVLRKLATRMKVGGIENLNRVMIHGLCTLDFHYKGYLSKDVFFEFKLLSLYYISGGKNHETVICSFRRDIANAGPVMNRLMYPGIKRATFALSKHDLLTEAAAVYNHKRVLREPEGVARFPYPALYEYARKFYPDGSLEAGR